ncbi:hypothetical protein EX30DRAFT_378307 [Ascodesmis nigricans]|uniref:Uncharacterized protein n=1 Tax=Ascodesmis nigricans TaxID=341454 RepID=A0A4S2MWC5_9PEZI|nr:hypothetical protein EX30DRAFT_378307 [Ascodesmis nigricans]
MKEDTADDGAFKLSTVPVWGHTALSIYEQPVSPKTLSPPRPPPPPTEYEAVKPAINKPEATEATEAPMNNAGLVPVREDVASSSSEQIDSEKAPPPPPEPEATDTATKHTESNFMLTGSPVEEKIMPSIPKLLELGSPKSLPPSLEPESAKTAIDHTNSNHLKLSESPIKDDVPPSISEHFEPDIDSPKVQTLPEPEIQTTVIATDDTVLEPVAIRYGPVSEEKALGISEQLELASSKAPPPPKHETAITTPDNTVSEPIMIAQSPVQEIFDIPKDQPAPEPKAPDTAADDTVSESVTITESPVQEKVAPSTSDQLDRPKAQLPPEPEPTRTTSNTITECPVQEKKMLQTSRSYSQRKSSTDMASIFTVSFRFAKCG